MSLTIFFVGNFALAQDFGIEPVNQTVNLSSDDPRVIVGRIIQIILSFLGVIVLSLMIYAGFLWTTSGGEEEKVRKAKNILRNAIIGLIITLSAWGITTFLLNRLFDATSNNSGFQDPVSNNFSSNYGLGAMGNCSVQSVYPENNQKDVPRNTSIIITFKEPVSLNSTCVNTSGDTCSCNNGDCSLINPEIFRLFKDDLGDACGFDCPEQNTNITDVSLSFSPDQKSLILTPLNYLGSQEENINYGVKVTSDLTKPNGDSIFSSCSADELYWGFGVSTRLDLTPPQVELSHLYPRPDNERDLYNITSAATAATAEIFVKDCPNVYKEAQLISVTPQTDVSLDYHGDINSFIVSIPADEPDKAQLFNGSNNNLLGIADFNEEDIVSFDSYLSLKAENRSPGNLWDIEISPEQKADSLRLNNISYTFSTSTGNNNILVDENNCSTDIQASNIQATLSGHPDVNVSLLDSKVSLSAKVAGTSGNSFILETSNYEALDITPFSGGTDLENNYETKDKKDTAMNTVIKIAFNEAVNPTTLSGPASEVSDYIKIINNDSNSLPDGSSCSDNSGCLSYNCMQGVCVGDYVNGRFMVSSGYRMVEFISDNECGVNGCGEKVYCLPPNSNLAVEIRAADLKPCSGDQDCLGYTPYRNCEMGILGYRTCQDNNQRNYPTANITSLSGITDLAFNSLDANRDALADGPISFFNENVGDVNERDSYRFSFFVSDKKELSAPEITAITPTSGESGIQALTEPVEITFNTLMMSSSLRSGTDTMSNGQEDSEHKLINLRSAADSPLGYWITSSDLDTNPLDGVTDITVAEIKHSPFLESFSYSAQVGSGVKDVYQNCFKPSSGPGCQATWENPSCCFGITTDELGQEGNCQ